MFLWPRPTAAAQTGTAATGTIKIRAGLGSYHYHCGGHPAHLHENGVCPYVSYVEEAAPAASPEETAAEAPENLYMVFDPIYYADHNPDLYEAFGYDTDQLQEHFLTCGMKEGRPGCADFNVAVYKEQNATWRRPTEMIWRPTIPIIWLRPRRGAHLPLRGEEMKPAWIQRPVLLILFSFLLSGCKGDMTDTGNETDIPDKNAVVTESMSEELPVEQTEESTSVLVQDLGELLCERDSVRDLMLVVDRRGWMISRS